MEITAKSPPSLAADALAGQLLVVGYQGDAPNDRLLRAHREGLLGGFIVFKRNLVGEGLARVDALADVLASLAASARADLPPLLAVDQEGGRVARLGAPVLALPAMRALAATGDADLVRRAGKALAEELRAIGFTMDFAPVLDVDSNPKNPIIGDRAFGTTATTATPFALAFADGMREGGLLACGKHYPGHGDTETDSHLELPVVRSQRSSLEATELFPFRRAAEHGLPAFMSAHVVYPALDERPATLAPSIASDLLRRDLGFRGVLFSDDLEMKALSQDIEITSVLAVEAGCDVLLVCSDEARITRAREAVAKAIEARPTFRARCEEALARGLAMRTECPPRPLPADARAALFAAHRDLADEIATRTKGTP